MLEYGDIIELEDNKKYIVSSLCTYKNVNYLYLVNTENVTDIMLVSYENDEITKIVDDNVFMEVMPLILDNVNKELFNEGNENE